MTSDNTVDQGGRQNPPGRPRRHKQRRGVSLLFHDQDDLLLSAATAVATHSGEIFSSKKQQSLPKRH